MIGYVVFFYNELDGDFGYDCGPSVYGIYFDKAVAKSIARHLNRTRPDFMSYWVEPEPERWT